MTVAAFRKVQMKSIGTRRWDNSVVFRCALWLGLLSFFGVAGPVRAEAPQLARQIYVPTFVQSDWQGSSFNPDGSYLLAVSPERSFFVETQGGRELRPVQLPEGEALVWSRARPDGTTWLAATSRGRIVNIDVRTGVPEFVVDIGGRVAAAFPYSPGRLTLEFLGADEAVVYVVTRRERRGDDGIINVSEDRALALLDVPARSIRTWRALSADEFSTNLDGRLVVNPTSKWISLYEPRSFGRQVFLTYDAGRSGAEFQPRCVFWSEPSKSWLLPTADGFLAIDDGGGAEYLDLSFLTSQACQATLRAESVAYRASLPPADCRWKLDPAPAAAGSVGAGHAIVVDHTLAARRLIPKVADCGLDVEPLPDFGNAYQPRRFAQRFQEAFKAMGSATTDDVEQQGFIFHEVQSGDVLAVAGGTLTRNLNHTRALSIVTDLVGQPTGGGEIEAAAGLIVVPQYLAPLRVYDTVSSTLRTIEYDYVNYFGHSYFFARPFARARGLGAMVVLDFDGQLVFHAAAADAGRLPATTKLPIERPGGLCVSDDGTAVWVAFDENYVALFERAPGGDLVEKARLKLGEDHDLYKLACNAPANQLVVVDSLKNVMFVLAREPDGVRVRQTITAEGVNRSTSRPSLSRDGRVLAVGERLFVSNVAGEFSEIPVRGEPKRLIVSDDGRHVLALAFQGALYQLSPEGRLDIVQTGINFGAAPDGAFLDDATLLLARNSDEIEFWSLDGSKLGQLVFGRDGGWLFSDDNARFDISDIERQPPGYWVLPEDPLRLLSPDLFMRDYFEPRLLSRLTGCRRELANSPGACDEFRQLPEIGRLNLAQPKITIRSVEPSAHAVDRVDVTIDVQSVEDVFGSGPARRSFVSGACDVRLFRDGRLVQQQEDAARASAAGRACVIDGVGKRSIVYRDVPLPGGAEGREIGFSTYAFNVSGVKSETSAATYRVPAARAVDRTAYVVAVGVSAYESEAWDLRYAANDAHQLLETLVPRLAATGRYRRVVPVALTSEWVDGTDRKRSVTRADATKRNVKAVFDALGGLVPDPSVVVRSQDGEVIRKAGPDDLVIILFAGHGDTQRGGNFYMIPYDIGEGRARQLTPELIDRAISSDELSAWLKPIDAGEMVLIIDACHSEAGIANPGFKPGPMGARGLGQLAYDKGMRVLTSTRAADVAWESPTTKQGLLSYALTEMGLRLGEADFRPVDGQIGLGEWLEFAAQRVPQLYTMHMLGETRTSGARLVQYDRLRGGSRSVEENGIDVMSATQRPAIFNFARGADPVLVPRP